MLGQNSMLPVVIPVPFVTAAELDTTFMFETFRWNFTLRSRLGTPSFDASWVWASNEA